jgi:hypothetical protein
LEPVSPIPLEARSRQIRGAAQGRNWAHDISFAPAALTFLDPAAARRYG